MRRVYFDASAIVKLVCEEAESLALVAFLQQPMEACTSAISEVEVPRCVRRRGMSMAEALDVLGGFFIVAIDAAILLRAQTLTPDALRPLDALHLATALELGSGVELVTYDTGVAQGARALGLAVVQPGREHAHPSPDRSPDRPIG